MSYSGVDRLTLDGEGNLVLNVPEGELVQRKPVSYQVIAGERKEVASRYVLQGEHEIAIRLAAYDESEPLVIDPVLVYSTYLGGTTGTDANAIAVDSAGNAYFTGSTNSTDFPANQDALQPMHGGGGDVYISKLNADGSALVYSTYLGGSGNESGRAIALDSGGNVYLTGETDSANFPTQAAVQTMRGGGTDVFAVKLNSAGNALVYSTYLGGEASI